MVVAGANSPTLLLPRNTGHVARRSRSPPGCCSRSAASQSGGFALVAGAARSRCGKSPTLGAPRLPRVSRQSPDSDQVLVMRAMQERRDPAQRPPSLPQTRQQRWTLVLRPGKTQVGQRSRGSGNVGRAELSCWRRSLRRHHARLSSIPRPTRSSAGCPTVKSFRLADGLGDDLGHSLGFLVGQEVAGAGDRDQVRTPDRLQAHGIFVGQSTVAFFRSHRHSGVAETLGGRLVSTEVLQVGTQPAAKHPRVVAAEVSTHQGRCSSDTRARPHRDCRHPHQHGGWEDSPARCRAERSPGRTRVRPVSDRLTPSSTSGPLNAPDAAISSATLAPMLKPTTTSQSWSAAGRA